MVLGICRFHRNSNGWDDVGYNFLVDKYGQVFEGRAGGIDQPVVGAQAQGFNSDSTGVANLGTYTDVPADRPGARRDGAAARVEAAAARRAGHRHRHADVGRRQRRTATRPGRR